MVGKSKKEQNGHQITKKTTDGIKIVKLSNKRIK